MIEYFFLFWFSLDKYVKIYDNSKLNHNLIKFFHSILSSILSYNILSSDILSFEYFISNELIYNFSKSYFLWDLFKIITENIYTKKLLIHHTAAIYALDILNKNMNNDIIIRCYYVTEMSNIPLFLSYHMINTKSKYKNIVNDIQIIFYLYFRFYKMSNYFYHNFSNIFYLNKNLLLSGIIIYLLGLKTIYDLLSKKYIKYKEIKKKDY